MRSGAAFNQLVPCLDGSSRELDHRPGADGGGGGEQLASVRVEGEGGETIFGAVVGLVLHDLGGWGGGGGGGSGGEQLAPVRVECNSREAVLWPVVRLVLNHLRGWVRVGFASVSCLTYCSTLLGATSNTQFLASSHYGNHAPAGTCASHVPDAPLSRTLYRGQDWREWPYTQRACRHLCIRMSQMRTVLSTEHEMSWWCTSWKETYETEALWPGGWVVCEAGAFYFCC